MEVEFRFFKNMFFFVIGWLFFCLFPISVLFSSRWCSLTFFFLTGTSQQSTVFGTPFFWRVCFGPNVLFFEVGRTTKTTVQLVDYWERRRVWCRLEIQRQIRGQHVK